MVIHMSEFDLTQSGESVISSEPAREPVVKARVGELDSKWKALRQAAADRGRGLRQASAQRDHAVTSQGARDRLASLKRSLEGEVTARDLRTCKDLLNKHQV